MTTVREFTEEELKEVTEGFSLGRKLGEGGFGIVFRGYINGTNIAVKKLTEVCLYDDVKHKATF